MINYDSSIFRFSKADNVFNMFIYVIMVCNVFIKTTKYVDPECVETPNGVGPNMPLGMIE